MASVSAAFTIWPQIAFRSTNQDQPRQYQRPVEPSAGRCHGLKAVLLRE
jgi:hypothetical protein